MSQRGVGEKAVGSSLSLIASGEDKSHARIMDALNVQLDTMHMDGRLLASAHERVNLACKVVSIDDAERKKQRQKQWFREKATEAGLELDEDHDLQLDDDGGDMKKQNRRVDAEMARKRLRALLSEPMQTQRYGKFLSTNSAFIQGQGIIPSIVNNSRERSKKRRRRK